MKTVSTKPETELRRWSNRSSSELSSRAPCIPDFEPTDAIHIQIALSAVIDLSRETEPTLYGAGAPCSSTD